MLEKALAKMIKQTAEYLGEELVIVCHPDAVKLLESYQLGYDILPRQDCPIDNIYAVDRNSLTVEERVSPLVTSEPKEGLIK